MISMARLQVRSISITRSCAHSDNLFIMRKDKWAEVPGELKLVIQAGGYYYVGKWMYEELSRFEERLDKFRECEVIKRAAMKQSGWASRRKWLKNSFSGTSAA